MLSIVRSSELALLAGVVYLAGTFLVFRIAHQRSRFSFVLIYSELFYIIGIGVGAIALSLDEGVQGDIYQSFLLANGPLDNLTFVHIIVYTVGMVFGMAAYKPKYLFGVHGISLRLDFRRYFSGLSVYWWLLILGVGFLAIYVAVVGPLVAFTTAGKARSNQVEELVDSAEFLFLKNLAKVGVFSIIFIPLVLEKKNKTKEFFALLFYGVALYVLNGARASLIDTIFLGFMIYIARRGVSFRMYGYIILFSLLAIYIIFYGKGLGDEVFSAYFEGTSAEHNSGGATLSSFLGQFVTLIFSVDAGIKSFYENGPIFSKALMLSPFGVMPGWLYSAVGFDWLNWQSVAPNENIVCLNTAAFPLALPCTAPPYYTGVAAYVGPVWMGFLFGFFRFYIFSAISYSWHMLRDRPDLLWRPLLAFSFFSRFTLLIPNVIGFLVFWGVILIGVVWARKIIYRRSV